jgi:Zn-dependent peptidase ImmA (M78 family)
MRDALAAAEALAAEMRVRSGLASCPVPIPVREVAIELGISLLPRAQMEGDGRLYWDRISSSASMMVNEAQPEARQRFTVAHETAHWMLRAPQHASDSVGRARAAFVSEEALCNAVAGALLMPSGWLRECAFAGGPWTQDLRTIERVAHAADVSLEAAVVRLRDVFGWDRTLVNWVKVRDRAGRLEWRVEREAGLYPWQRGVVRASEETGHALTELACSRQRIHSGVRIGIQVGAERDVPVEVRARSTSAVTLVPVPRYARRPAASKRRAA